MIIKPHFRFKGDRPKLKIPLTPIDWMMEAAAAVVVIGLWTYVIMEYNSLPDQIPAHFDLEGNPTRYDTKNIIWLIPCMVTLMHVVITIVSSIPHKHNYLVEITEENAFAQYQLSARLTRTMKLSVALVFFMIVWEMAQAGHNRPLELGSMSIVVMMGLIMAPIIFFVSKALTMRK